MNQQDNESVRNPATRAQSSGAKMSKNNKHTNVLTMAGVAVTALAVSGVVIACGGDNTTLTVTVTPDASIVHVQADSGSTLVTCGTTGLTCGTGQECYMGACVTACGTGTSACGAACANTAVDPANCGTCGTACAAGQVCSAGKCAATCSPGYTTCGGDAGAATCATVQNDSANCGGCGVVCATGEACVAGECTVSCATGTTACTASSTYRNGGQPYEAGADADVDAAPVTECVDTSNDNQNCGGCGTVCASGTACVAGACITSCGALTACTAGPKQIVGDGGVPFDAGSIVDAGDAGDAGDASDTGATTVCTDPQSDNLNCGGCNLECAPNTNCVAGTCIAPTRLPIGCTTFVSTYNHSIAVDTSGDVLVAASCGGVATVFVSTNSATSFATGVAVPITGTPTVEAIALNASISGHAYLEVETSTGVYFSTSTNDGTTWSTPVSLGTAPTGWTQIAAYGTNVYVGSEQTIWQNGAYGVGTFTKLMNPSLTSASYGGVGVGADGTLWTGEEDVSLSVESSANQGSTWGTTTTTSGQCYYSNWAFGPHTIAVASGQGVTSDTLATITYGAPPTQTGTAGGMVISTGSESRAIAVDGADQQYVVGASGTQIFVQTALPNTSASVAKTAGFVGSTASNAGIAVGHTGKKAYAVWTVSGLTGGTFAAVQPFQF